MTCCLSPTAYFLAPSLRWQISLVGSSLLKRIGTVNISSTFLAFGAGFMLAAAFLEMVPRSIELLPNSPGLILTGYLLVHLFEHSFAPHFHFGEEIHKEELIDPRVGLSALDWASLSHLF